MSTQTNNFLVMEQDGSGNFTGLTRTLSTSDAVSIGAINFTFAGAMDFDAGMTVASGQSIAGDGTLTVSGSTITLDPSANLVVALPGTGGSNAFSVQDSNAAEIFKVADDGALTLGKSSTSSTFSGSVVISEDLTVNGTTTTVHSTVVTIDDNILVVNAGPSVTKDAGYVAQRWQTENDAGTGDVVSDLPLLSGVAQAGGATAITLAADASAEDDYFNGMYLKIASGTGIDQVRLITDYDGTSKVATVSGWTTPPDATSNYDLFNKVYTGWIYDESADVMKVWAFPTDPGATEVPAATASDLSLTALNLTASGSVESTGTMTSGGDFDVNTNKFTVASASGNTLVAGTLTSTGAVEADSTLGADGDFRVGAAGASKFTVTAASGNTAVVGTLDVTGVAEFDNTLGADGNLRVGSGGASNFSVLAASGNTTVGGTLTQTAGQVTLNGNVDATAGLDVTGAALTAAAGLTVSAGAMDIDVATDMAAALTMSGNSATITHSGTTSLVIASTSGFVGVEDVQFAGANVGVSGDTDLLQLASGALDVNGTLTATGDFDVNTDKFTVAAASGNVGLAGTLTTADDKAVNLGDTVLTSTSAYSAMVITGDAWMFNMTPGAGMGVKLADQLALVFGTDNDHRIGHLADGFTWEFDNANANGITTFVLGADTSSSKYKIENNSLSTLFEIDGTGQADFTGNVDAQNGLDVTGAALTAAAGFTVSAGAMDLDGTIFALDTTSTLSLDAADTTNLTMAANDAGTKTLTIAATNAGAGDSDVAISADGAVTINATNGSVAVESVYFSGAVIGLVGDSDLMTLSNGDVTVAGNINATTLDIGGTIDLVGTLDDDTFGTASNTTLATSESIKAYVDAQATAASLGITGDTGSDTVDLDSETLYFSGGNGIDTTVTNNDVSIAFATTASPSSWAMDTGVLSLDGTDTTNLTMTANDAGPKTLAIAASNAGAGTANLDMDADGAFTLDAGSLSIDATGDSNLSTTGGTLYLETKGAGDVMAIEATGLMDINALANLDIDVTGSYDMLSSGVWNMAGTGNCKAKVTSGDLTLETLTAGDIKLNATGNVVIDATAGFDFDAQADITLNAGTGGNLSLGNTRRATTTVKATALTLDSSGLMDVNAGANLDIDATGTCDIDSTGAMSLDAGAASNFTTSVGALTLNGAAGVNIAGNAAEVDITTSGALDLNSGAGTWDASTLSLDAAGDANLSTTGGTLYLETKGAGDVMAIEATGLMDINALANLDIDVTGAYTLDTTGAADFTFGAASTMTVPAATGSAFAIDDGTVDYLAVNTSVGFVALPKFALADAGVGALFTSGAAFSAGDAVRIDSAGKLQAANCATDAAARFMGVVLDNASAIDEDDKRVASASGAVKALIFNGTALQSSDVSKPVYLSATDGEVTIDVPQTSGHTIYQIGFLSDATDGTHGDVVLFPRYVGKVA